MLTECPSMTASLTSFPCKYVSFLLSCLSSPSTFFRSLSPFELPVFVPLGAFVDRFAEHHDCVKWHCVFGFPWPSTARRSSVLALTLTLTPLVAGECSATFSFPVPVGVSLPMLFLFILC